MIFEGTKNQFFFGLELTRAGLSVPDSDMLITLADELDTYCIMCVYSAWFYCACGHAKFLSKVEL